MNRPRIVPVMGRRVEVHPWRGEEPHGPYYIGVVRLLTGHVIGIYTEHPTHTHRSWLLEDVLIHEPWDERDTA